MMLLQMIIASLKANPGMAVFVTVFFTIIPLSLGLFTFSLGLKMEKPIEIKDRIKFAIISLIALVTWSGLITGPLLALIGAVLPTKNKRG